MQRRLAGRVYDGCVVRVENEIYAVGWHSHVIDIQTEQHRGSYSTVHHSALYDW
jgi:hypothetical protein